MKKGIHPENYRPVVFKDMSNDEIFITRSTVAAKDTIEIDGVTYPLVKLEITSSSHPFFTGKQKLVDTAGRVDKFMSRYAKHMQNKKKYSVLTIKRRGAKLCGFAPLLFSLLAFDEKACVRFLGE